MRRIALSTAILVAASISGGSFAASAASAADTPTPETVTGIVQTLVREQPSGQHTDGNDTFKVIRVGPRSSR